MVLTERKQACQAGQDSPAFQLALDQAAIGSEMPIGGSHGSPGGKPLSNNLISSAAFMNVLHVAHALLQRSQSGHVDSNEHRNLSCPGTS